MTTAYSYSDILPKDAGGAKFAALINEATSQSDFASFRGIAASGFGANSYILAHQGIATHTHGSQIASGHPGVVVMGWYGSVSPQPASVEKAAAIQINNHGIVTSPKDFKLIATGSTATSAIGEHSLWGTYNGLSNINASVLMYVHILASAANFRLFQTDTSSMGTGMRFFSSASEYTVLPLMTRDTASQLIFMRESAAGSSVALWAIWK